MKWSNTRTIFVFLLTGILLAGASLIYLFFNIFHLMDIVVFLGAGFVLGRKAAGSHWAWGLVLALPTLFLDSYLAYRNGYSSLASGIGTGYLVSLLVVPLSACLGIMMAAKRSASPIA